MDAWHHAKAEHERWDAKPFEALLGEFIARGAYVWSSPTVFLLAMPVSIEEGELLHDPAAGDTWFVRLAAVDPERATPAHAIAEFLRLAPEPLPFVAWYRRQSKRLHRYSWDLVKARVARKIHIPTPA